MTTYPNNSISGQKKRPQSALFHTGLTIAGCLLAWTALRTTHNRWKRPFTSDLKKKTTRLAETSYWGDGHGFEGSRFLSSSSNGIDQDSPKIPNEDDEIARDDTCRDYLEQFLNGSTDFSDECAGIYNAYVALDCKEENINNFIRSSSSGGADQYTSSTESNNNNNNNTSVLQIDDFLESWACCDHIATYHSKHCVEEHLDATRLFGIVAVLIACWLAKSLLRVGGCQWIPDAGACILVGALVGAILRFMTSAEEINKRMIFNNNLFLQILLPPIIFEAALSINKRSFRRDLFPILTFAVAGTGISALSIGYITFYVSQLGSGTALPFLESLLFGALMSSIDPVATLSILLGVGVGQGDTLYTLVFGESLLNDGVSIVLFDSLVRHVGDADVVGQAAVAEVLWHFLVVTVGSVLVGVFCGALCTLYFWAMQGQHTAVSEGALFFTWALIPYYIADAFELSGIISIMVMGFMLDYYVIGGFQDERAEWSTLSHMDSSAEESVHPVEPLFERFKQWCDLAFSGKGHMQAHSRSHVGYVAEVISSIVETAIFAYLGLFLFNDNNGVFKLTAAGIFACVSSRAVMVLVLCALINICVWCDLEHRLTNLWRTLRGRGDTVMARHAYESANYKHYLGARTQFILFTAGIRGAVSYALVQNIPVYDAVTRQGSVYKGELRAMTSATIVGVLFVFGALTYFGVDRKNGPLGSSSSGRSSVMTAAANTPAGYMMGGEEAEASLSQLLMEDAHQLAASEEERERAASFEVDMRHHQNQRHAEHRLA
ncbi:hypothetical protein ACA910_008126 [Epithemia clementina (nom. ined.)]